MKESNAASSRITRRNATLAGAGLAATKAFSDAALAQAAQHPATPTTHREGHSTMSFVTMQDGTQIFYKDWGSGTPIVFHHGWPLSADD